MVTPWLSLSIHGALHSPCKVNLNSCLSKRNLAKWPDHCLINISRIKVPDLTADIATFISHFVNVVGSSERNNKSDEDEEDEKFKIKSESGERWVPFA